ncbi:related to monocarboxylate transporter [Armillaria ostoyae]|uniref:Related to monocarboxylate transporter n=1 Tax=Armillaria ostoyae TaxID=47428 RepID=A0A284QL04_ARMOS|nr:related to monocarboxylate transporter [Armillaria ostoyae]
MSTIAGPITASVNQARQDTIELEDIRPTPSTSQSNIVQDNAEDSDEAPLNATSLPPMDHGFDAWAYMISAWLVELLVWSYPFSYGVFLNYYTSHEFKDSPSTLLVLVGSLSTGLIYLSSIVVFPIIARYPARKKQMMYVGLGLSVAGLIGAAFSNTPEMLVLTQGVMYSIGGSFLYFPVTTYLFEWFSDKKGLANGLIFSGTGVGGVVMPIIIEALLNKYGRKVTMLALATSFALVVLPAFPYIKPRVPASHVVHQRPIDTQFLKYHPFWVLFVANLVQGLGIFLPTLYLPTFATDLGLNNATSVGTWSLSLMNGASAPGLIFLGYLSDRFDLRISIFISALGSSLAVLFIWGFTTHIAPLLVFACIYGFLAPSWSAMYPRFISTVAGDDPHQASIMMGIFMTGRGVGNALSTPISSGLLHPWAFTGKSIFPYSLEGYGPLILFTGITLLVSTLGISYRKPDRTTTNIAERIPRRFRRASISPP